MGTQPHTSIYVLLWLLSASISRVEELQNNTEKNYYLAFYGKVGWT